MNRRHHRARRRIDLMPGMNRECFHANFTPIFHNERNLGGALIGCQTFPKPANSGAKRCV